MSDSDVEVGPRAERAKPLIYDHVYLFVCF